MRIGFAVARTAVAAAVVAAIVGQLIVSIGFWRSREIDNIGSNIVNFFSFFTIEANIASAVICIVGAVLLIGGRGADPRWFQVTRASVVAYMVTTGIVYNVLLRGIELPQGSTLGWSNEILHVVAPIYLLIDWLFAPGRGPLRMTALRVVVIFPVVWAVYTLVRGPFVDDQVLGNAFWYPYPFLNPSTSPQGYVSVAFYVVLIAAVICLVGAGIIAATRRGTAAPGGGDDRPRSPRPSTAR